MPLSFTSSKYLQILFTAWSWQSFGHELKLAHWCVAIDISGLEVPCKQPSMPVNILYFHSCFLSGPSSSLEISDPTTSIGLELVILMSMLAALRMRLIKNGWVIVNPVSSGSISISTPKYWCNDPSSVKANLLGPYFNVLINISIDFWSRLSIIQSSTYTSLQIS